MMNLCKYVLALAVWLLATPSWAATLVQTATGANSCATSTATFSVAVTNGNSILVAVTVDGTSIPTPSDGTNTYSQIVSASNSSSVAIYRATNVTGSPSSVAVTSGICTAIAAYEVSGLTTGNDGFNSGTGTGTSVTTNGVTTTAGGILISVMGHNNSGAITPTGTGWTQGYEYEPFNTMNINSESQLSSGAATFSDTWTLATSSQWAAVVAAFKDTPSTVVGCRLLQDGVSKRLLQVGTDGRIFQGGALSACVAAGKAFPFYIDPFYPMIVR